MRGHYISFLGRISITSKVWYINYISKPDSHAKFRLQKDNNITYPLEKAKKNSYTYIYQTASSKKKILKHEDLCCSPPHYPPSTPISRRVLHLYITSFVFTFFFNHTHVTHTLIYTYPYLAPFIKTLSAPRCPGTIPFK